MVIWQADHPIIEIPTDLTTYQWAFESAQHSPLIASPSIHGFYQNVETKERLYYRNVKLYATGLHTALVREYGFQAGDTVTILAGNSVWYPVVLWSCLRGGGRINGASPAYAVDEMVHVLKTAKTKFLFVTAESLGNALQAAGEVGLERRKIFLIAGNREGLVDAKNLAEMGANHETEPMWRVPEGMKNDAVCGYLSFSSGTTGLPKAVMLSHHNIIAQCHQLGHVQVRDPGERYRCLAITPVYHISGLVRSIHYPLLLDGECYMMPSFSLETMLSAIVAHRIPELILVPPLVIRLVRDPLVDRYLPALRRVVKRLSSGSAPTSPEVIQQLHARFPNTGFRQGYGATESTLCISCHPPTHYDYRYAHTAGKLVPNTVAKVLPLDGPAGSPPLGPGQIGEICARGPQIAMGYLDNPSATRETFDQDGFLHTGDVGYIDAEGFLHIEDRIKEMIKVRGQQVAPAELEDCLQGHALVEDCAIIGIKDEYSGEKPKAFVQLKDGVEREEKVGRELLRWVKDNKVAYKRLVEVEFVDSIPKSPTGKVLRRTLKAQETQSGREKGVVVREERAKF